MKYIGTYGTNNLMVSGQIKLYKTIMQLVNPSLPKKKKKDVPFKSVRRYKT